MSSAYKHVSDLKGEVIPMTKLQLYEVDHGDCACADTLSVSKLELLTPFVHIEHKIWYTLGQLSLICMIPPWRPLRPLALLHGCTCISIHDSLKYLLHSTLICLFQKFQDISLALPFIPRADETPKQSFTPLP